MDSPRLACSSVYTPSHTERDSVAGACARSRLTGNTSAARTKMATVFFIAKLSSLSHSMAHPRGSFPSRWQCIGDVLARVRPAADGHDDVLLAVDHVRHRRASLRGRHVNRADFFSGSLVV